MSWISPSVTPLIYENAVVRTRRGSGRACPAGKDQRLFRAAFELACNLESEFNSGLGSELGLGLALEGLGLGSASKALRDLCLDRVCGEAH